MKTTTKQEAAEAPVITYNPELDKYDEVVLFPEKVAQARAVIARAGLPTPPAPKRPS